MRAARFTDFNSQSDSEPNLHGSGQARRGAEARQTVSDTQLEELTDDELFNLLYSEE